MTSEECPSRYSGNFSIQNVTRVFKQLTETEAARILELLSFSLGIDFDSVIDKKGQLGIELFSKCSIRSRWLAAALAIIGRFDLLSILPDSGLWCPTTLAHKEYSSDVIISSSPHAKFYVGDFVDPFWTKLPFILKHCFCSVLDALNLCAEYKTESMAAEVRDNMFQRGVKPLWIVQTLISNNALSTAIRVAFLRDTNAPLMPSHSSPVFSLRPGTYSDTVCTSSFVHKPPPIVKSLTHPCSYPPIRVIDTIPNSKLGRSLEMEAFDTELREICTCLNVKDKTRGILLSMGLCPRSAPNVKEEDFPAELTGLWPLQLRELVLWANSFPQLPFSFAKPFNLQDEFVAITRELSIDYPVQQHILDSGVCEQTLGRLKPEDFVQIEKFHPAQIREFIAWGKEACDVINVNVFLARMEAHPPDKIVAHGNGDDLFNAC